MVSSCVYSRQFLSVLSGGSELLSHACQKVSTASSHPVNPGWMHVVLSRLRPGKRWDFALSVRLPP